MAKPYGRCRLCGDLKELTKEHIPPKAAFNHERRVFETMQDALGLSGQKQSIFQGGIQKTTLCESCNNKTGNLYAKAFVEWSKQGFAYLDKIRFSFPLQLPFNIMPLNVIKQIIIMNLATVSEERIDDNLELRRFVLNPSERHLPPYLRIFTYLNKSGKPRLIDREVLITRVDIGAIEHVNSEIALPPFGYCVTSTTKKGTKSLAVSQGLYDVTWFSEFDYNSTKQVWLKLPMRETHDPFALDYRTEAEVKEHHLKNL